MRAGPEREVEVGQEPDQRGSDACRHHPPAAKKRRVRRDGEEADRHSRHAHLEMIRRAEAADERRQDQGAVGARPPPPQHEPEGGGEEERVQRVDPLDVRLGPEAASEGEEPRGAGGRERETRRTRAPPDIETRMRPPRTRPRRGSRAPGQRQEEEHRGPCPRQEDVQGVAGRVRDSHDRHRRQEVAAVADVGGAAGAGGVDREGDGGDEEGAPRFGVEREGAPRLRGDRRFAPRLRARPRAGSRIARASPRAGSADGRRRLRGSPGRCRGLLQPAEVLREERVAGVDPQALLESGRGAGRVAAEIGDVGAVLVDERQLRRRLRRLVELALRPGVVAAPRRRRGFLRERRRPLLRVGAGLLREGASEPVERANRRLVLRVVLDRLLVVGDRRVALSAALVDDRAVVVRLDVQRLELDRDGELLERGAVVAERAERARRSSREGRRPSAIPPPASRTRAPPRRSDPPRTRRRRDSCRRSPTSRRCSRGSGAS